MQRPQLRARLDAELADEDAAGGGERVQRLGLPSRPVQRQHQLAGEALPQRMLPHQLHQLLGRLGVAAERQDHLDALLDRGQPLLAKPGPDDLRAGATDPGQRHALPEPERRVERDGRRRQIALPAGHPGLRQPLGERLRVQLAGCQPQLVPGAGGEQHPARRPVRPLRLERGPQPGDVHVQRVHRAGGQLLAPQPVDELIAWHHLVRAHRQQPEHRSPLRRAEVKLRVSPPGAHRPEHGDPQRLSVIGSHPGHLPSDRHSPSQSARGRLTADSRPAAVGGPLDQHFQRPLRAQQEAARILTWTGGNGHFGQPPAPAGPDFEPIDNVSLDQFAAVTKAVAAFNYDGSKLPQIAAARGIPAYAWETACNGWNERIKSNPAIAQRYNLLYRAS